MSLQEAPSKIFEQTAAVARGEMQSREILDMMTGARIRMEELLDYKQVGNQYVGIKDIPEGFLWTPQRRTVQALAVLKPEFAPGSCVRIVRSSYFDLAKGEYIFKNTEGSTAEHLGMPPDGVARLEYHPETRMFHLIKESPILTRKEIKARQITPEEADQDLDKFFLS